MTILAGLHKRKRVEDVEELDGSAPAKVSQRSSETIKSHDDVAGDVIAAGGRAQYDEPVASYEGRHRWDPLATWTAEEEKTLVRRVGDLVPGCCYL